VTLNVNEKIEKYVNDDDDEEIFRENKLDGVREKVVNRVTIMIITTKRKKKLN